MNALGEATGVAADLELRTLLEENAERRTAADHAIEGLRLVARHAGTWADPDQPPRDPAEVLRTILAIAGDSAARARAMQQERLTADRPVSDSLLLAALVDKLADGNVFITDAELERIDKRRRLTIRHSSPRGGVTIAVRAAAGR